MRIASRAFVAVWLGSFLAASLLAQAPNHHAAAWSRFRGPEGSGIASESLVPWPWNLERATRIPLPGSGVGSPVVWENLAFVISASSDEATRHVIATDWKQGTIAWQREYSSRAYTIHKFSSYASSTPAVDASGVVVAWGDPEHVMVKKFTHAGQELWSRDLGPYVSEHGFGASPILVDGLVILLNSQDAEGLEQGVAPGEDRMIALDSQTGNTVWETPLRTRRVCYGSPTIRRVGDTTELVCATTGQGIF
ncbi:MAG: PQQ-binding-like beta-propeller repeat protein, partial [Planctomycetota bacterium]